MTTSMALATIRGLDREKLELAALFHSQTALEIFHNLHVQHKLWIPVALHFPMLFGAFAPLRTCET